jgi:heat shock protein HslJ
LPNLRPEVVVKRFKIVPPLVSVLLVGLSACVTVPGDTSLDISGPLTYPEYSPPGLPFIAQGQEPPWQVQVLDDTLTITTGYGAETRVLTLLDVEQLGQRTVFRAADRASELRVDAQARICRDSMSGMPYPYSVTLTGIENVQPGCGGRPIDLLAGKEWVIHSLDGVEPIAGSRVTLRFLEEDGRIAGSGSCNRYNAGYTLDGETLRFSDAASTKMGCAPELMRQEQAYHAILQGVVSFDIDDAGQLILLGSNGRLVASQQPVTEENQAKNRVTSHRLQLPAAPR